ncbi:hypothetical protein QL285_048124 [Trifolium repens]|nr:hypothetical protein QL285_048124 [Trifolium repens]
MRNSGSQRIDSQRLMQSSSTQYQRPASLNRLEHPSATRRVLQISTDLINGQSLLYQENPPTRSINHLPPTPIPSPEQQTTTKAIVRATNTSITTQETDPPYRAQKSMLHTKPTPKAKAKAITHCSN